MNFQYPNITGSSEREQILQIKRYLHQLVDQLNFEPFLNNFAQDSLAPQAYCTEEQYLELRSMIVNEIQNIKRTQARYVTQEQLQKVLNTLAAPAADDNYEEEE